MKKRDNAIPISGAQRVGFGYDIHRLVPGRKLILGGVRIPSKYGLEGHSDADVLTHAFCDALLGASALGDIGKHFPNTDRRFKNISSIKLLKHVCLLLKSKDFLVHNVDATVVLELPKLSPYSTAMRSKIARAIGISIDRVSIKATTNEGLGAIGSEQGCAAFAVATLRREGSR
jgi:2-C-methyl-D-erythritol 2,4-cyclodiphosphate synthase